MKDLAVILIVIGVLALLAYIFKDVFFTPLHCEFVDVATKSGTATYKALLCGKKLDTYKRIKSIEERQAYLAAHGHVPVRNVNQGGGAAAHMD